ncbi:MAG: hypothetical protein WBO37_05530 [Gammaproteobacteria bacterium]
MSFLTPGIVLTAGLGYLFAENAHREITPLIVLAGTVAILFLLTGLLCRKFREPHIYRQLCMIIALGSLTALIYAVFKAEIYFINPENIFSYYDIPLGITVIIGSLALLPANLGLSLVITLLLIGSIEAVCFRLNTTPGDPATTLHEPEFQRPDDLLGYTGIPGSESRALKMKGKETIYDVSYSLDEFGRRLTPVAGSYSNERYVMFFGGSFTFGEGLNNNETLPYWLAQFSDRISPYNYGHPGYGPQHVLTQLQDSNIRDQIPETDGILIYPLISTHIQRAIGSMVVYSTWGYSMPYYYLDADGLLKRDGNFTTGRPLRSMFYSLAGKSQLFKYLELDLPFTAGKDDFRLTAAVIGAARSAYREKFGNDNFYVLIWPGASTGKQLIPYLEELNIRYLDYYSRINFGEEKYQIQGDGHPSASAQQALARLIAEDIEKLDLIEHKRPMKTGD